jgi:predicted transport protein
MALFKIQNQIVKKLITKDLDLEKNLQSLFENNLDEILNISFLAHEYSTSFGGRIDTLGIDRNGSPCIIEYKKNQSDNVINQGLSYLRWLLDHKADFEILCRNKKIEIEIDWDSPRVICISESYNKFDIDTADILPINVELLRYRIYDNDILYIEPENYQKVKISTSGIIKKGERQKEKREVLQKSYTIDEHLQKASKEIQTLFLKLREKITSIDEDIIEESKAKYIAYKTSTNFVDVVLLHGSLKIFLNVKSGELNDPDGLARDLAKPKLVGHWGNGDYEMKLEKVEEVEKVFALIKQSYDLNK